MNESTPNLDLSIRAAVNTGEGLVTLGARPQAGEGLVTGDVVNTASRLQNVAPVNGVVVGEITYRSTKGEIVYEEMEPVRVKGKPQPARIWRGVSARGRFGVDMETRYRTPFIGRDFDLGMLKMTYQRVVHEASIQLVTVIGEPGVGTVRRRIRRMHDKGQSLTAIANQLVGGGRANSARRKALVRLLGQGRLDESQVGVANKLDRWIRDRKTGVAGCHCTRRLTAVRFVSLSVTTCPARGRQVGHKPTVRFPHFLPKFVP